MIMTSAYKMIREIFITVSTAVMTTFVFLVSRTIKCGRKQDHEVVKSFCCSGTEMLEASAKKQCMNYAQLSCNL